MNNLVRIIFLLLLSLAALLIWQKPASAPAPAVVRLPLPAPTIDNAIKEESGINSQWRVVTRRVISKDAIRSLSRRLTSMQLKPMTIRHQEEVILHAFDDAKLHKTAKAAWRASKTWRDQGIEVTIIEAKKEVFLVGLGRFYQSNYALGMQERLKEIGKEFRYQQRTVPIPTSRFTFPPMQKDKAETLWKRLNDSGVIMPVLMPEKQFQALYGNIKSE